MPLGVRPRACLNNSYNHHYSYNHNNCYNHHYNHNNSYNHHYIHYYNDHCYNNNQKRYSAISVQSGSLRVPPFFP